MSSTRLAPAWFLLLLAVPGWPGQQPKGDKPPSLKDDHKSLMGVWAKTIPNNDKEEITVNLEFTSGKDFLASGRGGFYKYLKRQVDAGWDIAILEVTKKRKDVVAGSFSRQAWPFQLPEKGKGRVVALGAGSGGGGRMGMRSVLSHW